jgi:unsaturated rhamnogalacturonyl hydrolase
MGGLMGNTGEIPANLRPSAAIAQILKTLHLVADWQIHRITEAPYSQETSWTQATFYLGLARLAGTSGGFKYFQCIRNLGQRNKWRLGPRLYHADDHAIGQVYVAAFDHYADFRMIAPMLVQFDHVLANKPNVALTFDQSHYCQWRGVGATHFSWRRRLGWRLRELRASAATATTPMLNTG